MTTPENRDEGDVEEPHLRTRNETADCKANDREDDEVLEQLNAPLLPSRVTASTVPRPLRWGPRWLTTTQHLPQRQLHRPQIGQPSHEAPEPSWPGF